MREDDVCTIKNYWFRERSNWCVSWSARCTASRKHHMLGTSTCMHIGLSNSSNIALVFNGVYVSHKGAYFMIVLVYMDDLILASNSPTK